MCLQQKRYYFEVISTSTTTYAHIYIGIALEEEAGEELFWRFL